MSSTTGTNDMGHEPFSCADVQGVKVRLSKPGFVTGPIVGLFLEYEGAPAGNKILDIWWDEKNKPAKIERLNTMIKDLSGGAGGTASPAMPQNTEADRKGFFRR